MPENGAGEQSNPSNWQTGHFVNIQMVMSAYGLAELLLKSFFALTPWARNKDALRSFSARPTITINPETAGIEVSFEAAADGKAVLEDALALLNNANDSKNRLIVVLDEFEEIAHLEPGTDELLCGVNHTARKFVGLMYIDRTLDETTILHFRHFLEKHDFGGKIFELINERFNEAGPTLCKGRIIDAIQLDTII